MYKRFVTLFFVVFSLSACSSSNDFMPSPDMTGEDIFNAVCVECHQPEGDAIMSVGAFMRDKDKITNKVLQGSMMMPSFPNIQGEPAQKLAEYVLNNSKVK